MSTVTLDGTAYYPTKEPELKYASNGTAYINFSVGFYQGKDKDKGYVEVTCWDQLAENVAASVKHGDRVVVSGRLSHRKWLTDNGANMSRLSMTAYDVGLSLRFDTASSNRPDDSGTSGYGGGGQQASKDALEAPW